MGQLLLLVVGALAVGAIGFGIAALLSGGDPGLVAVEPDGRAVPLPGVRPLSETDVAALRFDTGLRGYRMAQVDAALRRAAYDIGYKEELINVLEAEVSALRDGRVEDADTLRRAREDALRTAGAAGGPPAIGPAAADEGSAPDAAGEPADQPGDEPAPEPAPEAPGQPGHDAAADAPADRATDRATDRAAGQAADRADAVGWGTELDDSWGRQGTKLG